MNLGMKADHHNLQACLIYNFIEMYTIIKTLFFLHFVDYRDRVLVLKLEDCTKNPTFFCLSFGFLCLSVQLL